MESLFKLLYYSCGFLAIYIPIFHKTTNEHILPEANYKKYLPRFTVWGWVFFLSAAIYIFCSWEIQNIDQSKNEIQLIRDHKESHIRDSINNFQQDLRDRKIDSLKILISIIESENKKKLSKDNLNAEIMRRGNIHKLLSASNDLQHARTEYMSTFFNPKDDRNVKDKNIAFLTKSKMILDGQLTNPFLLSNQKLYNEWFSASNGIVVYLGGAVMPAQIEGWDRLYVSLDSGLFYISSKTSLYCWNTLHPEFLESQNRKSNKQ